MEIFCKQQYPCFLSSQSCARRLCASDLASLLVLAVGISGNLQSHAAEWQNLTMQCRNMVFIYFDIKIQVAFLHQLLEQLIEGGVLVLGAHECLPEGAIG